MRNPKIDKDILAKILFLPSPYLETLNVILGKLEVTEETIEPLLTAAKLLDMSVLTRLIESQKKNPNPTPEKKLKRINKDSSPVNPIQEAK